MPEWGEESVDADRDLYGRSLGRRRHPVFKDQLCARQGRSVCEDSVLLERCDGECRSRARGWAHLAPCAQLRGPLKPDLPHLCIPDWPSFGVGPTREHELGAMGGGSGVGVDDLHDK